MAGYYFEVLETVEGPEAIYAGKNKECVVIRNIKYGKYIYSYIKSLMMMDL